jgi:hypothetical protein
MADKHSATTTAHQMPSMPKIRGKNKTHPHSKMMVRLMEMSADTGPLFKEVKKDEA